MKGLYIMVDRVDVHCTWVSGAFFFFGALGCGTVLTGMGGWV